MARKDEYKATEYPGIKQRISDGKDNNNGYAKSAREFREELAAYHNMDYQSMVTRRNGNSFFKEYTLTEEARKDYKHVL